MKIEVEKKYKAGIQNVYARRVRVFVRALLRNYMQMTAAILDSDSRGYNAAILQEEWSDAVEIANKMYVDDFFDGYID